MGAEVSRAFLEKATLTLGVIYFIIVAYIPNISVGQICDV